MKKATCNELEVVTAVKTSSGMRRRVFRYKFVVISQELTASVFRDKQSDEATSEKEAST
jgi:hypothetical protein